MSTREFDLGDVLTAATGRMLSPQGLKGVLEVCSFLAGESLMIHQLARVLRETGPVVLRQHPQLDSPEMHFALGELTSLLETQTGKTERKNVTLGWLSKQKVQLGVDTLPLRPMTPDEHQRIDPISELAEKIHPDKIGVIRS
jgi:hypothetical protein